MKRHINSAQNLIKSYDEDKDGRLSDAERSKLESDYNHQELLDEQRALQQKLQKARMYAIYKIADKNGDGNLDEEEIAYARATPPSGRCTLRPLRGPPTESH